MHRRLSVAALVGVTLMLAPVVPAQGPAKPEGAKIDVAETLQGNLSRYVGEKVEVVLVSGKSLTGTVKGVGKESVHLAALEGKEFFDALVRVDQIGAIVVRTK